MEAVHPSEIIREEMEARGWDARELAEQMGGNVDFNHCALDLYFAAARTNRKLRLGRPVAKGLSRAFGTSTEFFLNLEAAWIAAEGGL